MVRIPFDSRFLTSSSNGEDVLLTSMLVRQSDGRMTRPIDAYLGHFEKLVACGLPIVLYLDPAYVGMIDAPNVAVIPTTIEDLETWRLTRGIELNLPAVRNDVKDNADYMLIQNAKTELVRRTIELGLPQRQHAFIDFGLFHIIQDVERAQLRIRELGEIPSERVVIPGIWDRGGELLDAVSWRFAGSLFYGSSDAMLAFADAHQRMFGQLLPRLVWEVNVWAMMEEQGTWSGLWYPADHNDRILDYPQFTPFGQ